MDIDPSALDALSSQIRVKFTDQEPRQIVQVEGFAPFHFSNSATHRSENLPGYSCGETIRKHYGNPSQPYETLITAFFIWLSRQWPTLSMIDVGALWGQIGLTAASIFGHAQIHFLEMNPFVVKILQDNVDLNRHLNAQFHVENMLLSKIDRLAPVTFKHYTARYGAGEGGINLSPMKIFRENLKSKIKRALHRPTRGDYIKREMRIATIDTYCREQNFAPNLIKIDVEGSEYDVLLGAKNMLLQHHPVLLVEFHPPGSANYTQRPNRELIGLLEGWQYRCLWTNHRDPDATLRRIDSHSIPDVEINSLGIFY